MLGRALPALAAVLPFLFIAVAGFPAGDDWQIELARIAAYVHALADGQLPPFWAPSLYAGYGSPIFLFYGHGFLALAAGLSKLFGGYGSGFVAALAAAALLGSVTARVCAEAAVEEGAAARVAAVLYLSNPYLLSDVFLRNSGSEYVALMLLPIALYGVWQSESGKPRAGLWFALGLSLTLVTHLLSTLILLGLTVLCVVMSRRYERLRLYTLGGAALVACALTAYAWLPVVAYRSQVRASDLIGGKFSYRVNFQPLLGMFDGVTPHSAGPVALTAALAALVALRRSQHPRRMRGLLLCFALLFLMQLPLSIPLWEIVPGLAFLQFPWRLMGPLALVSALLGASAFAVFTRGLSASQRTAAELVVCALSLLASVPQVLGAHTISRAEVAHLEAMLDASSMSQLRFTATARDEYLPPGADWERVRAPAQVRPIVSAPKGTRIAVTNDEPRALGLRVHAEAPLSLCLARWAAPGWRIQVDGRDSDAPACATGLLGVQVPVGTHEVRATLETPAARRWGLAVSVSSALVLLLWSLRVALRQRAKGAAWRTS